MQQPTTNAAYRDLVRRTNGTIFDGTNVTVGAASQKSLSFLRLYYDVTADKIYPFLTAIIDVNKGNIRGITWDNACVFCGGFADRCEENTYDYNGKAQTSESSGQPTKSCFFTRKQCDELHAGAGANTTTTSTACDITLYTVWSGTDSTGNALQSQAFRFSLFPPQQITDRITQLIPNFGLTADDIVPDNPFAGLNNNNTDEGAANATSDSGATGSGRRLLMSSSSSVDDEV